MIKLCLALLCMISAALGMDKETWFVERDKPVAPRNFAPFNSIVDELEKNKTDENQLRLLIIKIISERVQHCFIQILKQNEHKHKPTNELLQQDIEKIVLNKKIKSDTFSPQIIALEPIIKQFIDTAIRCEFFESDIYFKALQVKFFALKQMYINEQTLIELNKYLSAVESAIQILLSSKDDKQASFDQIKERLLLVYTDQPNVIKKTLDDAFTSSLRDILETKKYDENKKQVDLEQKLKEEQEEQQKQLRSHELFELARELLYVNNIKSEAVNADKSSNPQSAKSNAKSDFGRRTMGPKRKKPTLRPKFDKSVKPTQEQEKPAQQQKELISEVPNNDMLLARFRMKRAVPIDSFTQAIIKLENWKKDKELTRDAQKKYEAIHTEMLTLFQNKYPEIAKEEIAKARQEQEQP
jgi:hypothetical protein